MPRTYDAYAKYLAAAEIADRTERSPDVDDVAIVTALASIVDLLDGRVFGEQVLEQLQDTPELLLPIDDTEQGHWLIASTSAGRVHVFRSVPTKRFEHVGDGSLAGFDAAKERVIGLYATRRASRVRDQLEVLIIVRGDTSTRAHAFALEQVPRDIEVVGHHVPPALGVCPIALPLDATFDCFDLSDVPPEGALGAVLDAERRPIYVAKNGLAGDQRCREGRHVARVGERIATIDRHQTILWHEPETRSEWFWMLEHQPTCLAPLPVSDPLRMAIGLESGIVLIARDVGSGRVDELWQHLVDHLRQRLGLDSLERWLAWARDRLDAIHGSAIDREGEQHDQRAVVVLWLVLEQAVQHADLDEVGCAGIKQLFQQTLGIRELHVLHVLAHRIVARWVARRDLRGAAATQAAYDQLPHGVQDLFDAELLAANDDLRELVDAHTGRDADAMQALLGHCRVGRTDLYKKSTSHGKAMLRAEAQLEGYVRERAARQLERSSAVLRWPGKGKRVYMVAAGQLRYFEIDLLDGGTIEGRAIDPWFRPTQSVSLVRDADGRPYLSLVDARQLAILGLDADTRCDWSAGAADIIQITGVGPGELLALRSVAEGTSFSRLHFGARQIVASASTSFRRRLGEHTAALSLGNRCILLASDITGALAAFEILADTIVEIDPPQVLGSVRSIATLEGPEPAWLVGTVKGALYRLELEANTTVISTRWIYRHRGAVRHIAVAGQGERTRILTMSAPFDATVLTADGRRRWHARFGTPLRTAVILDVDASSRLAVFDVEGRMSIYFEPDFPAADEGVADQGDATARRELWQAAVAARSVPAHSHSVTEFRSRAARAAWFHGLVEQLDTHPEAVLEQLERDSAHATFRDRLVFIRSIDRTSSATVEALWRWLLDDYRRGDSQRPHRRGDDSRGAASAMFAELVRTTARCRLDPTRAPFTGLIDELIQIDLMSESKWIVQSLLLWAHDHLDMNRVIAWATRLGPLGLAMARHLSSSHAGFATQLTQMCRAVAEGRVVPDTEPLREDRELNLLWLLLRLLTCEGSSWPHLVELAHRLANVREGTHPRPMWLHPSLVELMEATREFWVFHDANDMRLDTQRDQLDQIKGVFLSAARQQAGPWSDWLAIARPRLEERASAAAQDYWRKLPTLLRAHMPEPALDVFAQGRIARIRVELKLDGSGDEHTTVTLCLELPESCHVLPGHPATQQHPWTAIPANIYWLIAVPPRSTARITATVGVRVEVTRFGDLAEVLRREVVLPLPAAAEGRRSGGANVIRQLNELSRARQGRIRVFALDPETLADSEMVALVGNAVEIFDADRELRDIPPTEILGRLAVIPSAVAVYPMVSTAARLLELGADVISPHSRTPQLWLLPPDLAGTLHARLYPALRWGAWYLLDPDDDPSLVELAKSRGDDRDTLRSELIRLGGDLRALWRRPGHERVNIWITNPDAMRGYVRHALAGCDAMMLIGLVLASSGRVAVARRDLARGLIADESIYSTAESGRSKLIVDVGDMLDGARLHRLASDRRPRERLWVRGWAEHGMQGSDLLMALERIFAASKGGAFERLADRGLVAEIASVVHPREPLRTILRALMRQYDDLVAALEWLLALDLTPLRKASPTTSRLLGQLTISTLAPAGPLLPNLCGTLSASATQFLLALAALHREGPNPTTLGSLALALGDTAGAIEPLEQSAGWRMSLQNGPHLQLVWCSMPLRLPAGLPNETAIMLGPGARAGGANELLLDDDRIRSLLAAVDVRRELMNMIITRAGFEAFNPYQVGNALPGDSAVFVGRASETDQILRNLHQFSFLIVGGRQIGKTSLLRHVERQVRERPNSPMHALPWLDLAGKNDPRALLVALHRHEPDAFDRKADVAIDEIEFGLRRLCERHTKPVALFIDEVDAMLESPVFERLRGLSQQGLVQCVMTGYHRALTMTSDRNHPFFHWVRGSEGSKAFVLRRIEERAAIQLIERLEAEPLALKWAPNEREAGIRHLIDATHRIPILLQAACTALVRRVDAEGRRTLARVDVEGYRARDWQGAEAENLNVRTTELPVWSYVQMLQKLPANLVTSIPGGEFTTEPWVALVLGCVVHRLYFEHTKDAMRVRPDTTPKPFSPQDAIAWTNAALSRHLPIGLATLHRIFTTELYSKLFNDLSLTVLVEPVPGTTEFQFAGNIYPIELGRFLQRRNLPSVDEWLLTQIANIEISINNAQ